MSPVNKLSYSSGFKPTMDMAHRGQVASFLQSEHSVSNSQRCLFIDANSCHKPNWYVFCCTIRVCRFRRINKIRRDFFYRMHHDIDANEKDSSQQLLPEIADYAEVNPNTMSTFLKDRDLSSPAPYATTTLVSNSSSRNVNSWNGDNSLVEIAHAINRTISFVFFIFAPQMRHDLDEDTAYASANIYRTQNVYSESGYSCCSSNNDCQSCAGTIRVPVQL